mgnify:CR=1 FL=1
MVKVIGVRFRTAGKIYFFSPGQFDIKQGDNVIVETARGVEFGRVVKRSKRSCRRRCDPAVEISDQDCD